MTEIGLSMSEAQRFEGLRQELLAEIAAGRVFLDELLQWWAERL